MKTYPEIQETIARAIVQPGSNPDRSILGEAQSNWPIWMDHKDEAARVISALTEAGCIIFNPLTP